MSTRRFAGQMKSLIEEVKAKGTSAIHCDNLIAYLTEVENSLEPEPTAIAIEKHKADLQNWIEEKKHNLDGQLELFRSAIASGQGAIKSSLLLNGGASVALLAFIGHLAQFRPTAVPTFGACLLPFAFGVLAIAITSGTTYLSQWFYASPRLFAFKLGFAFNIICILLGLTSYGLFTWGLLATYRVLSTYA